MVTTECTVIDMATRRRRPWVEPHEDVEWIASFGATWPEIERRVGMSWENIARAHRKHGVELPRHLRREFEVV